MTLYGARVPAWLVSMAALATPLLAIAWPLLAEQGYAPMLSERELVRAYQDQGAAHGEPLYYLDYRPVSASFYSLGRAGRTGADSSGLEGSVLWLAVHRRDGQVPDWSCTLALQPGTGLFDLYRCAP